MASHFSTLALRMTPRQSFPSALALETHAKLLTRSPGVAGDIFTQPLTLRAQPFSTMRSPTVTPVVYLEATDRQPHSTSPPSIVEIFADQILRAECQETPRASRTQSSVWRASLKYPAHGADTAETPRDYAPTRQEQCTTKEAMSLRISYTSRLIQEDSSLLKVERRTMLPPSAPIPLPEAGHMFSLRRERHKETDYALTQRLAKTALHYIPEVSSSSCIIFARVR